MKPIGKPKSLKNIKYQTQRNRKPVTTPIDDSKLSIREYKPSDKYDVFPIMNTFRRDYYINVYKTCFRSWFAYGITGVFLAISLSLIQSSIYSVCLPPVIVTLYVMWKVRVYKSINRLFNINDVDMINQLESQLAKYRTADSRRQNQGVYLAFLREKKSLDDLDSLEEILNCDLDDIESDDLDDDKDGSKLENKINVLKKNKKLVGYLIYNKQKDELDTVCIKELCIDKDYRKRKIATNFVRRICQNVFKAYGYKRVCFNVSTFHTEALKIANKKTNLFTKMYTWIACKLIPLVEDERSFFTLDLSKI